MSTNGEADTLQRERRGFSYSPERRTALVLCGTGAHGAYHAGVLRALQEAGVKIDVMAGQGAGAAAAALAAIDGAARLWEADGVWRGVGAQSMYDWKWPLRVGIWVDAAVLACLLIPFLLFIAGLPAYPLHFLIAACVGVITFVLAGATALAIERRRSSASRTATGAWWWRLLGAPIDVDVARRRVGDIIWHLIRGGPHMTRPAAPVLGRRYAEVLAENLGQPGYRELMMVATDLDARRDVVAALLREPYRDEFNAPQPGRERGAEAIDLAGAGRDHAFDFVAAGLTPGIGCDPHLMTFAPDTYWRGETHRVCDRPGAVSRLLDELAAAAVSQAVIVSAVATPPPHRLRRPRLELQQRIGEFFAADESAALHEAMALARLKFDAVYLICPAHNPVGPFDVGGAYDDASDRRQELVELMERAYEDAYRQFIEPVVGASGDQLARETIRP